MNETQLVKAAFASTIKGTTMKKETQKTIIEIEELVKRHQIDTAISQLEQILSAQPENAEARMLFGVCKQMKGETEVFCQVYRDLVPALAVRESAGDNSPVVSRWRQYCKVAMYLFMLGIVTFVGGNIQVAHAEMDPAEVVAQTKFSIKAELQRPEFAPLLAGTTNIVQVALDGSNILVVAREERVCRLESVEDWEEDDLTQARAKTRIAEYILVSNELRKKFAAAWGCDSDSALLLRMHLFEKCRRHAKLARAEVVAEDEEKGVVVSYMYVTTRMQPATRPMTKYNMGGSRYNMGGEFRSDF